MAGARFAGSLRVAGDLFAGGALDGITTPSPSRSSSPEATYAHLGPLVSVGAPYAPDWIGVSAEAGLSLTMTGEERPLTRAYAKGSLVVQIPRARGVRPFLALSYIGSNDGMNQTVMADLGLAWGAW
jgi:hypothetical protein